MPVNPRCSICLELFTPDCSIKSPECGHAFHDQCISLSFRSKPECPICRKPGIALFPVRLDFNSESDTRIAEGTTATKTPVTQKQTKTSKMSSSKCGKGNICTLQDLQQAESGSCSSRSSSCAARPQPVAENRCSSSRPMQCAARPPQTGGQCYPSPSSRCAMNSQPVQNRCSITRASNCASRPQQVENSWSSSRPSYCARPQPAENSCSSSRTSYCAARPQPADNPCSTSRSSYCAARPPPAEGQCYPYRSSYCGNSTSCNRSSNTQRTFSGEVNFLSFDAFDFDMS